MANVFALLTANSGPIALGLSAVVLILLVLSIVLLVRMSRLERHYRSLLAGTNGGDLQMVLDQHLNEVRSAMCQVRELDQLARQLEADAHGHVQHVGLLRFNPFRDTGGDQSFAIALADGEGNGAVVSSLHNRDVTRVYAKPLKSWQSTYPLTDEEQQAIERARTSR